MSAGRAIKKAAKSVKKAKAYKPKTAKGKAMNRAIKQGMTFGTDAELKKAFGGAITEKEAQAIRKTAAAAKKKSAAKKIQSKPSKPKKPPKAKPKKPATRKPSQPTRKPRSKPSRGY